MYQIKINGGVENKVEKVNGELVVNGDIADADIKQISANVYHALYKNRSLTIEVVSFDKTQKTAQIKVGNNVYDVTAKDQFDLLLDKLGLSDLNSVKVSEIKAPMPGLVLKVFVSVGDEVKKGDNLFVLEAMKMENIIKSPADVVVKAINIQPGDKVEKGQILMQF